MDGIGDDVVTSGATTGINFTPTHGTTIGGADPRDEPGHTSEDPTTGRVTARDNTVEAGTTNDDATVGRCIVVLYEHVAGQDEVGSSPSGDESSEAGYPTDTEGSESWKSIVSVAECIVCDVTISNGEDMMG